MAPDREPPTVTISASDERQFDSFMAAALEQADRAAAAGDVPIGAVVARGGEVVAAAHNRRIIERDPTAHAEMLAITQAAEALNNWCLMDATIYTTLEPCAMCTGAMVHARVKRLVFGAYDPKAGAAGSVINLAQHPSLNHRIEVTGGVLAEECGKMLSDFFLEKRQ
jgi:tRNA(adenine34) deaminase